MSTATKKADVREKREEKESYNIYIKNTSCAVLGFLFSFAKLPWGLSPFSCAFLSSVESENSIFAFLGSALSYFVFFPIETALKYFASLSLLLVLRLLLLRKMKCENKAFPTSVMCAASLLAGSLGYLFIKGIDFEGIMMAAFESGLSFLSVMIFNRAFHIPLTVLGLKNLSAKESFYLFYTLCSFLVSFSSFTIGDISPVRIITVVLLLFVASYKGAMLSSVFGIVTAFSFCIVPSYSFLFPVYTLASSVSGLFVSLGQYACSLSFFVCAFFVALFQGFDSMKMFALLEIFLGAVIYSVVPVSKISLIESRIEKTNLIEDKRAEREVSKALKNTAEKISNVSKIVENVSSRLDKVINPEINKVFSSLQQGVCFGCGKKKECWNKYFNETANDIMIISGIRQGTKGKTSLESRCIKPNSLLRHINHHYGDFVSSVSSKMKISEMRGAVSDQFLCVSDFLYNLSEKWDIALKEDESRSRSIFSVLKDSGIDVLSVRYLTNSVSPVKIELEFYENINEIDFFKIQSILELTTSYKFKKPQVDLSLEGTKIIFSESFSYKLIYGYFQIPLSESKICGDAVGHTLDDAGNETVILSDGMGTGSRAYIDASMTVALLENLLSAGFSFENSIRAVNSALIMKSTDESLSTVDTFSLNLYTGKAVFHKAGATFSFIRRKDSVKIIKEETMPVGIIRSVSAGEICENMKGGDIVLLVSDGVTANDCGWINDEMLAWSTNNMEDLAKHIASLSKMRSTKDLADDITVVAIKVLKTDF